MENIIKTDNYLLIVSDEEIKEGDWYLNVEEKNGIKNPFYGKLYKANQSISKVPLDYLVNNLKKIIAHLPLNNSPILEGVPLLPPIEDDVEEITEKHFPDIDFDISPYSNGLNRGFKQGYNKAKEKYKYTEEDLRDAYDRGLNNIDSDGCPIDKPSDDINDFIQSLQQPKYPIGFECEIEVCVFGNHTHYDPKIEDYVKPKTTTNSQGQTVLVGKYIW
jgi:hypothetical protein